MSDKTLDRLEIDPGLIKLPNLYYCDQLSNCSNQSLNQGLDNINTLPGKVLSK